MAITLVPEATPSAPYDSTDYSKQNALISANEVPDLAFLTDWELTATAPLLKKGVYIYHAGNTYIVDTADEAISGTPAAGVNYIEITLSGSTLTAAWVTVTTGYTYNPAYGGIYNGSGNQLLPDVCYLSGTDYIRGRCFGMDYNFIHLADGNFIMASGIDTLGANIDTNGGDIFTGGGDLDTENGNVDLGTGFLVIEGDNFPSSPDYGTVSLGTSADWTPSEKGLYSVQLDTSGSDTTFAIQKNIASVWTNIWTIQVTSSHIDHILLPTDGTNMRIFKSSGSTGSVKWIKC